MGKRIQHKHFTPAYRSIFRHLWWWTFIFGMVLSQPVLAQTGKITGTVRDEKGQPLPAVSVQEKKTGKTVMTDGAGHYSIEASAGVST